MWFPASIHTWRRVYQKASDLNGAYQRSGRYNTTEIEVCNDYAARQYAVVIADQEIRFGRKLQMNGPRTVVGAVFLDDNPVTRFALTWQVQLVQQVPSTGYYVPVYRENLKRKDVKRLERALDMQLAALERVSH
jgi:hypothetical protein